jgi:putative SOS response-associated peptidase YedK
MCNRCRPTSVVRYRDAFGMTYIESGPPRPYRAAIGPLQDGPFVRTSGFTVGQWGLMPDWAKTRKQAWNNARWGDRQPEKSAFRPAWARGQRCLIPVDDYDEPYWPDGEKKCTWWRFGRADGAPWMLAGVWNDWTDHTTGEIVPSYTMLTINCNAHPLLSLMHKPDVDAAGVPLPLAKQDKRSVVPLEREHWDAWLHGTSEQAASLIALPGAHLFAHRPADPSSETRLPT